MIEGAAGLPWLYPQTRRAPSDLRSLSLELQFRFGVQFHPEKNAFEHGRSPQGIVRMPDQAHRLCWIEDCSLMASQRRQRAALAEQNARGFHVASGHRHNSVLCQLLCAAGQASPPRMHPMNAGTASVGGRN